MGQAQTEQYGEGFGLGYDYAAECWADDYKDFPNPEQEKADCRETLAELIYRQPPEILREYVVGNMGFGLDLDYYRGFEAGVRKALDELDANTWLASLPDYTDRIHAVLNRMLRMGVPQRKAARKKRNRPVGEGVEQ